MTRLGRSTFWVYVLQLGGLPLSAALLPLLLWRFSLEQLAIWYLIQNLGQLMAIAEGALEPALTRYLTYARTGVSRWPRHGEAPDTCSGQQNPGLMQEAAGAARWIYRWLGIFNLVVLGAAAATLLLHVGAPLGDGAQVFGAWGLFCVGQSLGTRWMAAIPLLQGSGHADAAFRALAIQRLVFGVVAALGLVMAGRLEVLGLAQLAGAFAGLGPAVWLARRVVPAPSRAPGRPLRDAIWRGSAALWLSRLGGYLVVRANLPMVSAMLGLGLAGRLALTMQLIEALTQLSQAPMFASLPRLYELRARAQAAPALAIVGRLFLAGWLTFLAGGAVLLVAGNELLSWLGKPGALLAFTPLALLLFSGLLELNFNLSTTLLMVGNRVPFLTATLVSGVVATGLNVLALTFTSAGLLTVIAVPLLVQGAYNHWKWPLECLRLFQTTYLGLLRAARPTP